MRLADPVIIAAFAQVGEAELKTVWKPDRVDEKNRIKGSRDHVPPTQRN